MHKMRQCAAAKTANLRLERETHQSTPVTVTPAGACSAARAAARAVSLASERTWRLGVGQNVCEEQGEQCAACARGACTVVLLC